MPGKTVIPAEEMVQKIKAAVDARRDSGFIIKARTDAAAPLGIEETVRRLNMYAEAGADILLADALTTREEIATVAKNVPKPVSVSMGLAIRARKTTPPVPPKDLEALGVKLVLVHGSRPQIEAKLKAQKLRSRFAGKLRITDAPALEAAMEVAGKLRVQIEALLSMGLPNSPMAGAHIRVAGGNFVTARPIGVVDGVDLIHTGEVRKIDSVAIERRLKDDDLVVVPPLGYSPTGEVFNLAMGDVAAATAAALKADKLIFLMESAGVAGSRGELLRELTVREARGLLAKGRVQSEEMQAYLPAAVRACEQGVGRVHLISGHLDDSLLLELFTHKGVGTLLTPDPIETLRHAKIDDIGGILALLEPLEIGGILVKRSRDLLEMEIDRFWVLEHDRMIIGCAGLYPFSDERAGELAGLAVHPDFRGRGAGERLMAAIEKRARGLRLKQLFVLTTRTEHWFVERGYVETGVGALPQKKKELYNYHRRSVVLTKRL